MATTKRKSKKAVSTQKRTWKPKHPVEQTAFIHLCVKLGKCNYAQIEKISTDSGVHFTTLYKWARHETRYPRMSTVCAVADAMGYKLVLSEKVRNTLSVIKGGKK